MDWDWPEDHDNGDLGDAETADLADDPDQPDWSSEYPPVEFEPDDLDSEDDAAGAPPPDVFGGVDAHVDEPLGTPPDPEPGHHPEPAYEPVFGAPDTAAHDGWAEPEFPPGLDLPGLPDPVDGPPWTDAALLGGGAVPEPAGTGGADPAALFDYAGLDLGTGGEDPWAVLLASDDPATSALARWWGPAS